MYHEKQLKDLKPQLAQAAANEEQATEAYKAKEKVWKDSADIKALLDQKKFASDEKKNLEQKARDLMIMHRNASGRDLALPEFTVTEKMVPDLDSPSLINWLIDHMPHLAKQVMVIDPKQFEALLADIAQEHTDRETKGKSVELRPAFAAMPLMFKRELNTTIRWKELLKAGDAESSNQPTTDEDAAPARDNDIYHITRMVRSSTKNGSPMWQCMTAEGERVNIFKNSKPERDTFGMFAARYYDDVMVAMEDGEALDWTRNPIPVKLQKDGSWWKIVAVPEDRPETAVPDIESSNPADAGESRNNAIQSAQHALRLPGLRIFDTETTGTGDDAEIVQISVINAIGTVVLNQLIKPSEEGMKQLTVKDPQRGQSPSEIHGITPDMLKNAPIFQEVYDEIKSALAGHPIVAYNADYDVRLLRQDTERHGLAPIIADDATIIDPMTIYAEYRGEWNALYGNFKWHKLGDACISEGLEILNEHDVADDCRMTLNLLKHIAGQGDPAGEGDGPEFAPRDINSIDIPF